VLLYDFTSDPLELDDIAGKHPQIVERMQKAVDEWFEATLPVLPAGFLRSSENLAAWRRGRD
jgi:hypothetical protein